MDIVATTIQLAAVITALSVITVVIKKQLSKDIGELSEKISHKDKCECKRYLTDFLTDIESGIAKSSIQIQMASETYDHYFHDLKGNSWIEDKWNKLMK